MAAEAATDHAEKTLTAGDYIGHHLMHLRTHEQAGIVDFTVFNIDSIVWSLLMGLLGLWVLRGVARRVTSGVPGRMQAAVEIVLEMVDNQAKSIVHNAQSRKFVGPLRAHCLHLDLPDERDGLPAGGSDSAHLGGNLRRRRPRSAPCLHARGSHGRSLHHARHVDRRAAGVPLLQRQDQGHGRLDPRALLGTPFGAQPAAMDPFNLLIQT